MNETLKWLSSLPILVQESFWWWQCSDTPLPQHLSLPQPPYPPPPFSLSLISLMVSVAIKHPDYLLTVQSKLTTGYNRSHCKGRPTYLTLPLLQSYRPLWPPTFTSPQTKRRALIGWRMQLIRLEHRLLCLERTGWMRWFQPCGYADTRSAWIRFWRPSSSSRWLKRLV